MPENVSLNFEMVKFTITKDESLILPLLIPDTVRFNTNKEKFANEFIHSVSKKYIKENQYLEALKLFPNLQINEKKINVLFDKSKEKLLYPELNIEFTVLYANPEENKYIGFVPVLGIESFAQTEDELDKNITENIKLEFARNKRLISVDLILSTIWFEEIKSVSQPVNLEFYTLSELEQLKSGEKKQFLPEVAEQIIKDKSNITFGLEYEKKQLIKALQGKYNRSIILIGPSGIGKTSLVYDTYNDLANEKIWETTATQLIQKLTVGDGWQQNLSKLCNEIGQDNNILFIRNLSDLFETGQYEGNNTSLAEYLRKYIERGEITIITECTEEEAAQIDILSPAYLSLFNIIHFEDVKKKDLNYIISNKTKLTAHKNNITISPEAIKEIIQLQQRYIPYSGFPGKTIHFLESTILNQKKDINEITKNQIIKYFCEETGLPDFMIEPSIPMNLEKIENFFKSNIFGQEMSIETIINLLVSVKTGLSRSGKPIASLLFVGPTGVGKTEMAKILAQFMFGNRQKMIRFDMSEYSSAEDVLRLTGLSFYSEGILTSKVRQEPFSVVLFDELEKAHYSFFDLLLQILGEGRLTDSKGKITDFCSTIIIMTSNIGAKDYQKGSIGFIQQDNQDKAVKHFMKEVQNYFRPELFNRIDQIIPFLPLDKNTIRHIVQREINQISKREGIKHRNIKFEIDNSAFEYLCDKGYDAYYGARQMQRVLSEQLLIPLSQKLNKFKFEVPLVIKIEALDNQLNIMVRGIQVSQNNYNSEIPDDERILEIRRQSQQIIDGEYYIKLLSEIDLLEHKKRKLKNDFWKNNQDSENYTNYLRLNEQFQHILKDIEKLEIEIFTSQMDIRAESMDFSKQIKEISNKYLLTKIELYRFLKPESDICTIGIYGTQDFIMELFNIYQTIGETKGFESRIKAIWLRSDNEPYFISEKIINYLTQQKVEKRITDHLMTLVNKTFTRIELGAGLTKLGLNDPEKNNIFKYLENNYDNYFKNDKLTPEKESDKLLGIEIEFKGSAAYLYFRDESGVQQFKKDIKEKEGIEYNVQVYNSKLEKAPTPDNIHRKNFAEGIKGRRIYAPYFMQDSYYKLQENNFTDRAQKLQSILDNRFTDNLTSILIDEEEN